MNMKRRRFIVGIASAAIGSATVIGTGAFSTTEADRQLAVEVKRDPDAYLGLQEVGSGARSMMDDKVLKFQIPGSLETSSGDGLGTDSIYRFASDANETDHSGLFEVINQGTKTVEVFSSQETTEDNGKLPEVTMFDVETGALLTTDSPSDPLDPGEMLIAGLVVDTHSVDVNNQYDVILTINAQE